MDKIKKVFTFGCSFSDYMYKVDKPYGHCVAEQLNSEYVHEGAGCGSNSRIFRKFFSYLRNGDINKETLTTFQFTEISRDELWFYNILENDNVSYHGGVPMIEEYKTGGIFKYKWDSYKWNNEENLSKIMKDKTDYCINEDFDLENIIYSIIEVCKFKKIPFVMINGSYNDYENFIDDSDLIVVDYNDIQQKYPTIFGYPKKRQSSYDYSHLSQKGHTELAKKIINKIEL